MIPIVIITAPVFITIYNPHISILIAKISPKIHALFPNLFIWNAVNIDPNIHVIAFNVPSGLQTKIVPNIANIIDSIIDDFAVFFWIKMFQKKFIML